MKTLTISLVFAILVATVGLGWLFDQLVEQYYGNDQQSTNDAVGHVEQFGLNLAQTLNGLTEREKFIEQWQLNSDKLNSVNDKALNNPSDLSGAIKTHKSFQLELVSPEHFLLPENLLSLVKKGEPLLLATENNLAFHYYLPQFDELLIVKSPLLQANHTSSNSYVITAVFYFSMIIAFLLWAYPLIRRLIKLRTTAKAFGKGHLKQRIPQSPFSYITDIENEFNSMAQRIENLINDVKLLSSAVSHDLRTPLARIRFGLDTLAEEDDPVLRDKYVSKIGDNIDEMTDLVNTLLNYARIEQAMLVLDKEKIELTKLINKAIKSTSSYIGDTFVEISFTENTQIHWLVGDKPYLTILINNLLQNAVNYGNGQVKVAVCADKKYLNLKVSDNGPGVADNLKENIFKPFVRGENNASHVKGYGVGLAMVKRIVDWHQGEITVSTCPNLLGALFTVKLLKLNEK